MSIATILMYLCIPIFGNGAYFLAFGKDGPECGTACLIFFNISFLCLFLPFLFSKTRSSSYLDGGRSLFTVWYLILESILAFLLIYNDGSVVAATVTQFILLGLFLICFFGMSAANKSTDKSYNKFETSKSQDLIKARLNLQMALNSSINPQSKERIRVLIAEINSSPIQTKPETQGIERLICEKTSYISSDSQPYHFDDISNLLMQRKILLFNLP